MTFREVKQKMPDGQVVTMRADMRKRAVRVRVKGFRNCLYVFEHPGQKYPTPFPCPACRIYHTHKAHHLHLDSNGETTVSTEIYERMKEAGVAEEVKGVKEVIPRPQAIGMPFIDASAEIIPFDQDDPQAPQPDFVVSQTKGLIKSPRR